MNREDTITNNWRGRVEEKLNHIEEMLKNHLKHHWQFEIALIGLLASIFFMFASILWR